MGRAALRYIGETFWDCLTIDKIEREKKKTVNPNAVRYFPTIKSWTTKCINPENIMRLNYSMKTTANFTEYANFKTLDLMLLYFLKMACHKFHPLAHIQYQRKRNKDTSSKKNLENSTWKSLKGAKC